MTSRQVSTVAIRDNMEDPPVQAMARGGRFMVDGLRFDNFEVDNFGTKNVDPFDVEITPVGSGTALGGFEVSGGMVGDMVTLQFDYNVTVVSGEDISGALIWLTDYSTVGTNVDITGLLTEDDDKFRELGFVVIPPLMEFLADADKIIPLASSLALRSTLTQNLRGSGGFVETGAYVNLFRVGTSVPEPTTATLVGLGLAGLGFFGRRKKGASF